jgi:Domain of unknown function (DUF4278)
MQLIYRGAAYAINPSKTANRPFDSGSAYDMIYRGVSYRVDPNAKLNQLPLPVESYKLIYRGVTHFVSKIREVTVSPQSARASNLGRDASQASDPQF